MPTLAMVDRERGLTRDRPRLNWPGNYVTLRRYNKVWFIPYSRVDANYVKFWPYAHPYTLPIGYVFAPVVEPRPRPLQPTTSPEAIHAPVDVPPPYAPAPPTGPSPPIIPSYPPAPPLPITPIGPPQLPTLPTIPIPTPPTSPPLPPGTTGPTTVIPLPATDFMGDWLNVSTTPAKVSSVSIPVRSVSLFAHPNNTADILFKSVKSGLKGGRLPPGAGIVLEIDDPAKIVVFAESGTQILTVAWELAKYGQQA